MTADEGARPASGEIIAFETEADLSKKREAYLRIGTPAYWAVDLDQSRVLVWSSASLEPTIVTDVLRWQPRDDVPALVIRIEILLGKR